MSGQGNKEIFSRNLRLLMGRFGRDRNQVCDDLGFKYTTFADWYNGKKYPRIDKIEMLANYFGVLKSDLIEDKGGVFSIDDNSKDTLPPEFVNLKRIPVLGRIAAGIPIYAEENIEGYTFTDLNGGHEYFGLKVEGDSMNAARINDGDTVIVRRQDTVESGQIAVVLIDGEDATVKKFSQVGNVVTLIPDSLNPMHQPLVYDLTETKVEILGLVVRVEFSLV